MADRHFQFASPFLYLLPRAPRRICSFRRRCIRSRSIRTSSEAVTPVRKRPMTTRTSRGVPDHPRAVPDSGLVDRWQAATAGRRRSGDRPRVGAVLVLTEPGAWVGSGVAVVYLAVRLARMGKTAVFRGLLIVTAVGLVVLVAAGRSVITDRLANGKSNTLRGNLSGIAVDAIASPILGYGDRARSGAAPVPSPSGRHRHARAARQQAVGATVSFICRSSPTASCTCFFLGFFA